MADFTNTNHELSLLVKAKVGVENCVSRGGEQQLARVPWNKGRVVGKKEPFNPDEVTFIKGQLAEKGKMRDLILFATGLDTMLRSSDVRPLRGFDFMTPTGWMHKIIPVKQRKTKYGHLVALQDDTQELLRYWIRDQRKTLNDYVFTGRNHTNKPISYAQHENLVKQWAGLAGLPPENYGTHSIRRTKAWLVYQETKDIEIVRLLLGQQDITSTIHYLNITMQEALDAGLRIHL